MRSFLGRTPERRVNAPIASDYVDARVLAAATYEGHAIPTQNGVKAKWVILSATGDFWAKFQDTATSITIPGADVIDGSAPMLNPGAREIPQTCTSIALISSAINAVTMEFYY